MISAEVDWFSWEEGMIFFSALIKRENIGVLMRLLNDIKKYCNDAPPCNSYTKTTLNISGVM